MTVAADPPYLLGIDIGTTNLKANLYDVTGRRVAAAARPTVAERRHPRNPDWAEYSPDTLWQATADNIREVVSQIPDAGQIKALAVVGMGEPIIPVDERGDWLLSRDLLVRPPYRTAGAVVARALRGAPRLRHHRPAGQLLPVAERHAVAARA